MPRVLRSRGFVLVALAAFVLAQPAAWCSALCLLERHHAGAHAIAGVDRGGATLGSRDCHPTNTSAVRHGPLQDLSPMAPARAQLIAAPSTRWVGPAPMLVTTPLDRSPTAEPPPPRLV
jgi:hypothetical protein